MKIPDATANNSKWVQFQDNEGILKFFWIWIDFEKVELFFWLIRWYNDVDECISSILNRYSHIAIINICIYPRYHIKPILCLLIHSKYFVNRTNILKA